VKFILATILFVSFAGLAFAQGVGSNPNDHYVSGYTNNRGTYVEPHYQTNPNGTRLDNYETRGNYNPHNGTYGTRNPY
jgi:hypothetical protein